MASVLQITAGRSIFSPSGTGYVAVAESGGFLPSTETSAQVIWRSAGTFSKLYIRIVVNTATTNGSLRFRKNAADGNQNVSITSNTTGDFEDTTNTDAISAGDKLAYRFINGATNASTIGNISSVFAATTNTVKRYSNCQQQTFSGGALTAYSTLSGSNNGTSNSATESVVRSLIRTPGTFKNFSCFIRTNTIAATSNCYFRINGADKTLTFSITASTTGTYEDTTHSDAAVSGDLVCYKTVTTTTGTIALHNHAVDFETTDSSWFLLASSAVIPSSQAANITRYHQIGGDTQGGVQTTEADLALKTRLAFTAARFFVSISANSVSAASTATMRKSAADTTLTTSITASTTGNFEDLVHNDSIASTDTIDTKIVTGATGTSLGVRQISVAGIVIVTTTRTQLGKSRVQKSVAQTQLGKARVTGRTTKTQAGKGDIRKSTTQTQAGKARVQKSVTRTITGVANIEAGNDTTTQDIQGKGRVQKSVTQTTAGKARITAAATRTQAGKARIQKAATQSQTGLARIQKSTTQTTTGKARVTASTSQTQLGKARVQKSVTQTQQGKARIQASSTATITGKARIQAFVLQLITGKSRIEAVVGQTIDGRSRIQKAVQATITGISRITAAGVRTITGRARITATEDQTIQGLGRVTAQSVQTISGRSRITKVVARVIQGVARIMKSTLQTIQGKARIKVSVQEDIDGQSRIQKRVTQTITGRAQIKSAHIYPYTPKTISPYSPKASPFTAKSSPFTPKTGPYTPKESPYRKFQD